jgi:DNA-binding IscR family transcriptional regulator
VRSREDRKKGRIWQVILSHIPLYVLGGPRSGRRTRWVGGGFFPHSNKVESVCLSLEYFNLKISSRFSVAVHILSLLVVAKNHVCTSELVAGSVNTNPVVIRRVIGLLKKAGLVNVNAGCGGAYLLKPIENITLLDIYKAVEVVKEGHLFQIHEKPNQVCAVGCNIQQVLEMVLTKAQISMEEVLQSVTMKEIIHDLLKKK